MKVRTPFGLIEVGDGDTQRPPTVRTPFGPSSAQPGKPEQYTIRTPFGYCIRKS